MLFYNNKTNKKQQGNPLYKTSMKFIISTCLFLLVLVSAGTENGDIENPAQENVVHYLPKKEMYIDRFNWLKKLAESDLKIVKFLAEFRDNFTSTSNTDSVEIPRGIDEYIYDFTRGNGQLSQIRWTKKTAENIAKNPISSYRLLRRYTLDLPKIFASQKLRSLPSFSMEKLRRLVIPKKMKWPTSDDLEYAIDGILRLQQVYNISAEQFSRGSLAGLELSGKLDLDHIYDIGDHALLNQFYALAIEWWEFGLQKIQKENITDSESGDASGRFRQFLQVAKDDHDAELRKGNELNLLLFDHFLKNEDDSNEAKVEKRVKRKDILYEKFKGSRESQHSDINLLGICSGKNFQSEKEKSRLFCWREFTVHPKYRIGPLKKEFLSRQPDVYMIHNFVADSLIKKIRTAILDENTRKTNSSLRRNQRTVAKETGADTNGRGISNFLWDGLGTTLGLFSLAQNVQDATGLKAIKEDEADQLYVVSYTWATFAKLHSDGGWLANALHYLTDVELGGYTAFPRLGFSVKPSKGSLVVWFNQLRDQEIDFLTEHKGCPIIFGRKQVATKWISSTPQFLNFQCDLRPGQRFKTKVNGRLDY